MSDVLGHISFDNHYLRAKAFRLRFNLAHDIQSTRRYAQSWERQFLRAVKEYSSLHLDISYAVSGSLDIELADDLASDTKFFSLTIIIMAMYASFVTSGGDWVSTRMLLAQAGVVAALLAIMASFGLLCMCGLVFVDICGVMPFLVLGKGLDDMFILLSGWRRTDVHASIEDRIAETFRTSAISMTITSLTDLLAFCIGATSPFLSVKNFCVFAGVAVFFCYLNQLTFFGGFLVLHARRVYSSRHCMTCRVVSDRDNMEINHRLFSKADVLCCSGSIPKEKGEEDSVCEKIPSSFLPKFLMSTPMKFFVMGLFIVYIVMSTWGASEIKTGVKFKNVVPEKSYFSQYIQHQRMYYVGRGQPVMFVITEPTDYSSEKTQLEVQRILALAMSSGYVFPDSISWLSTYLEYANNNSVEWESKQHFLEHLRNDFLPRYPEFQNDVIFSDDHTSVEASRFYLTTKSFNDSDKEANMMISMRYIASNSTLPMLAYSPQFIYFEHYVSILKDTLLAVGVAIIGMLFIALMFIPHPIAITCVTLTMVTIVLGMFGFMNFWGLELSVITKVQIILSVGFCVDFTIHTSHAFMAATGKNRNERVLCAMEAVGVPIMNGAFTSILGILMLAFASSYVFKSFFKTMLLVIVLGVAHSLLFLPVMLSFIGPRRTAKPVFIPVHHSARGILGGVDPTVQHSFPETDPCPSSPSTKEEDLSDIDHSPTKHHGLDEFELIRIDSDGDETCRKTLAPLSEEIVHRSPSGVRFKVMAQDSLDTASFQSLDIMNT
ncbi:hypothetical protein CAPTEDRAFT_154215 [Capitella teleta]|uniref:SSD domain-containing protein n=1 Tax=Capitella teleta TaxID=283909 RepID=R7U659_CAPTE|nr:hypothetical protein CAPTEDRAFT_154215 [Capitella teleta]|eukprot:ELT98645.1 hypothetical protein CAPTEDRAFT_154215 [Capitella teleta]